MFRLINLALALSALANVVLTPSRLLSAQFVSPEAARTFHPFVYFLVETGMNLLVPAAIFLIIFCAFGLHKKARAKMPSPPFGVALTWILYFGSWLFPYMLPPSADMVYPFIFLPVFGILGIFAVYFVFKGIINEFIYFYGAAALPGSTEVHFLYVAGAALSLVFAAVAILWFSPGDPIHASAVIHNQYDELCKDVGVQFFKKIKLPVRSVAYDWEPTTLSNPQVGRYKLEASGRIREIGGDFGEPNDPAPKLNLEFTEKRRHDVGLSTNHKFVRFLSPGTFYGIDAFTADVLVTQHISNPEEAKKAPIHQGMMQIAVTVTDVRTGDLLAKMTYATDRVNGRACGSNRPNLISESLFLRDALTP